MRLLMLSILVLVLIRPAASDAALRGAVQLPQGKHRVLEGSVAVDGANTVITERELQQTNVQSFLDSHETGTSFNDSTPTGITGPVTRAQPQIAESPNFGGGPGIVFGGGAQPGAPGIAGSSLPILGRSKHNRCTRTILLTFYGSLTFLLRFPLSKPVRQAWTEAEPALALAVR